MTGMTLILIKIINDLSLYFAIIFYLKAIIAPGSIWFWLPAALPVFIYGFGLYKNIRSKNQVLSYGKQKDYFLKTLRFLPLFLLPAFFTLDLRTLEQQALPWLIVYLFSGVVLLNLLRHNASWQKNKLFLALHLGGILLCSFLCLEAGRTRLLQILGQGFLLLYKHVISPLLILFGTCISFFIWLFVQFITLLAEKGAEKTTDFDWSSAPSVKDAIGNNTGSGLAFILSLLKPLLFLAVIGAMVITLKRLSGTFSAKKADPHNSTSQQREALPFKPPSAGLLPKIFVPKDPRLAVRFYYRKFLTLCLEHGIAISPSNTSSQIQEKAQRIFPGKTLQEIRQLYIAARYDDKPVSPEEVEKIKSLYKEIKKQN